MKGDRNKLRALEAKARFGEGSERASARKLLAKVRNESPVIRVDNLPDIAEASDEAVSMEQLMNEFGDALNDGYMQNSNSGYIAFLILIVVLFFTAKYCF
jgi:hypothetical protein